MGKQIPSTLSPAEGINWSFSKLITFEQCRLRFKMRYIDKVPEPPKEANNPLERGNRIHSHLEEFVDGSRPTLNGIEAKQIGAFESNLNHLRNLYADGIATAEDDWFFANDWSVTDRPNVWLWAKLDFLVLDEPNKTVVIGDYKSGKSGYKTMEHIQQLQLYSAITAIKYPWAERICSELWYVDEGWIRQSELSRERSLFYVGRFDARVQRIYSERFFPPSANVHTCRFCPYGVNVGNGACPSAVGVPKK